MIAKREIEKTSFRVTLASWNQSRSHFASQTFRLAIRHDACHLYRLSLRSPL
jgi:hypothetical protein